jgi:thymidylate synthase ThyX
MSLDIFCLIDDQNRILDPAVQATALAKYSRSPESARVLLKTITQESAEKFQQKWVAEYGHNSVAELATVPICFEGVSIVASKFIESWPRAGYSEKSTRYQKFSSDGFVVPPGCSNTMMKFVKKYYESYDKLYPKILRKCAILMGEDPDNLKPKAAVRARAFDNIRYLLPAGTGTNLAAVMNMRDARDLLSSLKGHENSEFNFIGDKLQNALEKICPVLLKHTEPNSFMIFPKSAGPLTDKFDIKNPDWCVNLQTKYDSSLQDSFKKSVFDIYGVDWETFSKIMGSRPDYSEIPDIFKTVRFSFEVIMDFGAFRDLQRHRRCNQFAELLTTNYGYLVPDDIKGTELESEFKKTMELVELYDDLKIQDPLYNQYIIPIGYLHRSIFEMDLKELYYISELRTKPQGHQSYRRVAYEMFKLANDFYPDLMKWCRVHDVNKIGEHT